jgi:hypothetical protein
VQVGCPKSGTTDVGSGILGNALKEGATRVVRGSRASQTCRTGGYPASPLPPSPIGIPGNGLSGANASRIAVVLAIPTPGCDRYHPPDIRDAGDADEDACRSPYCARGHATLNRRRWPAVAHYLRAVCLCLQGDSNRLPHVSSIPDSGHSSVRGGCPRNASSGHP